MDLQIANKVAIITGGTKGIGEGIARVLSREGAKLVLVYRSDDEYAKKLKEELDSEVMLYKLDITKHAEIERMYAEIIKHYGTIDILVNNAAGGTISKPLHELSYSEWKECEEGCLERQLSWWTLRGRSTFYIRWLFALLAAHDSQDG